MSLTQRKSVRFLKFSRLVYLGENTFIHFSGITACKVDVKTSLRQNGTYCLSIKDAYIWAKYILSYVVAG